MRGLSTPPAMQGGGVPLPANEVVEDTVSASFNSVVKVFCVAASPNWSVPTIPCKGRFGLQGIGDCGI